MKVKDILYNCIITVPPKSNYREKEGTYQDDNHY